MTRPASNPTALDLVHRGWEHLRLQRPLAAWASWQRALRTEPGQPAATEALEVLDSADELPAIARSPQRLRPPSGGPRRASWDAALAGRDLPELRDAATAFAALAERDPGDGAARFNLALCLAWMGENAPAVAALDAAVEAEAATDPEAAVASARLAEILRQGGGAEPLADDLSHSLTLAWDDEGDPLDAIRAIGPTRAVPAPDGEARVLEWLDGPLGGAFGSGRAPRVLAVAMASPASLRLSNPDPEALRSTEVALESALGGRFRPLDRRSVPLPIRLMDAGLWMFRVPEGDDERLPALRRSAIEHYYEDRWINRGRIGLRGTPLEASKAVDPASKARLSGVIDVREALAARPRMAAMIEGYPFDRLRRRLGLPPRDDASIEPEDVTSMSRDELAKLDAARLSTATLAEAIESSRSLGDEALVRSLSEALDRRRAEGSPP